jgi:hypothetical protein
MRKSSLNLAFLVLTAASCLGQQANVSVSAKSGLPVDPRPFGRYLVEACTVTGEQLTLTCARLPYPNPILGKPNDPCPKAKRANPCQTAMQATGQTITMKVVCDPASKEPCEPSDPKVGADFFVSATADSGLPVQQRVLLGSATPLGGYRTVHYRANAPGPLIIRATAPARSCGQLGQSVQACGYAEAPPVDLILQVSAESTKSSPCLVLPPSVGSQSKPLDAPTIVSLLGNPTPFILAAEGSNTIFIYATRLPLQKDEHEILGSFQQAIAELAGRTAASLGISPAAGKPFSVELRIPHAGALGDLATRIGALNYSQFVVQDVTRDSVRVTAPAQPDCDTWKGFLSDIRTTAWQLISTPMSDKLFYLSSSDVATAFSGLASPPAAPSSSSTPTATTIPSSSTTPAASSAPAAASPTPSTTATASPASGATSATPPGPAAAASAAPSPPSASGATIAISQPPGSNIQISSDTTPCVVAGLAFGNSSGCAPTPAAAPTGASNPPSAPAPPAPLAMASVAVAAGTGEQTPPDLLVYSDTNPGDDAQIEERNRILAQLDLPRPEMILSAWVTQNSSTSPQAMGAFNNMVKTIVADYNDEYEKVILRAWISLKQQQSAPDYFNEPFRTYISDRFVADTYKERKNGGSAQDLSQAFLDHSQAKMADPVRPVQRTSLGICDRGRYCLGYNGLFRRSLVGANQTNPAPDTSDSDNGSPIKPALTDLLFAIVAAQHPIDVTDKTIDDVEGVPPAPGPEQSKTKPEQAQKKPLPRDLNTVPPDDRESYCDNLNQENAEPGNTPEQEANQPNQPRADQRDDANYRKQETRKRCHAIWRTIDLDHVSPPPQGPSCEDLDFRGTLGSLFNARSQKETRSGLLKLKKAIQPNPDAESIPDDTAGLETESHQPRLYLECFRKAAHSLLASKCKAGRPGCKSPALALLIPTYKINTTTNELEVQALGNTDTPSEKSPYGVGLFRAAIADFLFNYKMSQQYPHEFVSYDLTQSANALNNALSPLIDAFNRDLWSYQMFVRADMQYQVDQLNSRNDQRCCVKKLFGLDKPSFFNDGLVTVRTISGQATSVSTTSQSFLNGSTAPELSSLLSSLSGSGGGAPPATTTAGNVTITISGGSAAPAPGGGGSPTPLGLISSALANYQTTFAQIGRQLSFSATPRTLATASSAEIAVTLNADESASGPIYTGPGATDPAFNTSRVANHDTTTRVRVDSIKLFEVSSFSAIVERSRSRFPLLPPFVEIPYIGTFAGIPLGSAKEFHGSSAIISAYVVPTAADIAYGLHFVSDLAVDGLNSGVCSFFPGSAGPDVTHPCLFRKMISLNDVGPEQPIREFNKLITRCFATDTTVEGCQGVSFDNTLESR